MWMYVAAGRGVRGADSGLEDGQPRPEAGRREGYAAQRDYKEEQRVWPSSLYAPPWHSKLAGQAQTQHGEATVGVEGEEETTMMASSKVRRL